MSKTRRIGWKSIEREDSEFTSPTLQIAKQLSLHTPQWETGGLHSEKTEL